MALPHLEDNLEDPLPLMGLIPTSDHLTRLPHLGSCRAQCCPLSHLRRHIIEVILLHLAFMAPHHLGFPTNLPLRHPRLRRIDQRIYPLALLALFLLAREEAVGRETIDKLPVNPTPMPAEG